MSDGLEVKKVVRKPASSGRLEYSPVVVLNATSKSRLQAVGYFIPHTDRTEFSLKLEGFTKSKDLTCPPFSGPG